MIFSALRIGATALLAIAPFPGAYSQTQSAVGQWACQMTYTEFDQMGNRTSGFVKEYFLAVHANGAFEVAGNMLGAAGTTPFQGQGQWSMQGGLFSGQGPIQEQSMFGSMSNMFVMLANVAPDGRSMMFSNEQADPNRRYVMSRSIYACDRRG